MGAFSRRSILHTTADDEADYTTQKRKEVEGCLFVVKRSTAPRFQICVSNRLSTTNMTLAVDERLEVDAVDSFMILRAPDAVRYCRTRWNGSGS